MSTSQRKDGRWIVKYRSPDGWKQRAFRDEQTALSFDAEQTVAAEGKEERLSVGELVALFFRSNPDKHPQTKQKIVFLLSGYEHDGEHVPSPGEFLLDKYADALTRQDLERMREGLRARGAGNNTINKYQAYLRAILSWGADQDLISHNPWRDYKRLKVTPYRVRVDVGDLRRLFPQLPPYLQWAVKTAYFLALRPGQVELFSLKWTAFNWRRGVVTIRQGKSGICKTVVPNPVYIKEAFQRYNMDMDRGIVLVCHRNGRHIISYRTAWKNACKRAGVTMRFYDVRHIAASEMLTAGADLSAVAAQMGHSSIQTTATTYAHVAPGAQARAASLMPGIEPSEDEK